MESGVVGIAWPRDYLSGQSSLTTRPCYSPAEAALHPIAFRRGRNAGKKQIPAGLTTPRDKPGMRASVEWSKMRAMASPWLYLPEAWRFHSDRARKFGERQSPFSWLKAACGIQGRDRHSL